MIMVNAIDKERSRSRKITQIWAIAGQLGIAGDNKDLLYVLVGSITGSNSISSLTDSQLDEVISALIMEQRKITRSKSQNRSALKKAGVLYLPTPEQKDMITSLLNQLTPVLNLRNQDAYLESICKRTYRKSYKLLSLTQTQSLIETLKSILYRSTTNNN